VSFAFYLRGWRGITVEPNPWLSQLSEAVRPRDIRVASLVGAEAGEATYYLVEDFHGLSTTVESHARAAHSEYGKPARAITMPVTTLRALCEQHAPAVIDFLKIDVEGAEREVLRGGDWQAMKRDCRLRSASFQSAALASRRIGSLTLPSPVCFRHAAMLRRWLSLKSVGHHVTEGNRVANATACWPVPPPISSTSPGWPCRKLSSTGAIAS
jgi:FkbM family methyltransferase